PKVSGSGSQRVPLLMIMNANGGADAVINGGLNFVLWCAGARRVAREFGRNFEAMLSQDQYFPAPPGIAAKSRALPYREARIVHAILASLFVIGQILRH